MFSRHQKIAQKTRCGRTPRGLRDIVKYVIIKEKLNVPIDEKVER